MDDQYGSHAHANSHEDTAYGRFGKEAKSCVPRMEEEHCKYAGRDHEEGEFRCLT
jgi:hypothetical protein